MGTPPAGGDSSHRLLAPTLAEQLRAATGGHTVAMSLKPRSAITLAGRKADAALWFDERAGWATSSAFTDAPVPWVQDFITANPISADQGKVVGSSSAAQCLPRVRTMSQRNVRRLAGRGSFRTSSASPRRSF